MHTLCDTMCHHDHVLQQLWWDTGGCCSLQDKIRPCHCCYNLLVPVQVVFVAWTAMLAGPMVHGQTAAVHGIRGSFCRPGCTIMVRPLQQCQVASGCCQSAGVLIPGSAVLPGPFEQHQMASLSCVTAGGLIPGTWRCLLPGPLQHCQVAPAGCTRACPSVPRAVIVVHPLQDCQVAAFCCCRAGALVP